jgi:transposase
MGKEAKFIVQLSTAERDRLLELIAKGKRSAAVRARARILLKADASESGPAWTDERIAEVVEVSLSTVHRARQSFVENGLEETLERKQPTDRQYRKLDGDQEAYLIATACSTPPAGRTRWTLRLLADKLVALEVVDSISHESVRRTLKKTRLSRI